MLNRVKKLVGTTVAAMALFMVMETGASAEEVTALSTVNVRSEADSSSDVISSLSEGSTAEVLGTSGNWIEISVDGETGYVYSSLVSYDGYDSSDADEEETSSSSDSTYSASYFRSAGVINWNGYRWTWYSENVLPGGGLDIPGRYTDSNGYVCDGDGYICLASSDLSKGTVVSTPFGKSGKVYDSGCASGTLDVYVSW